MTMSSTLDASGEFTRLTTDADQRYQDIMAASEAEFPWLLDKSRETAMRVGVSEADWGSVNQLLDDLRNHCCNTCNHCIRVGLLSAKAAPFLGLDIGEAFQAGTLHDIGKAVVPVDTLRKSILGQGWTEQEDRPLMEIHPQAGAQLARAAGVSRRVTDTIDNHHALQEYKPVGNIRGLDVVTKQLILCVRVADFVDASYRVDEYETESANVSRHIKANRAVLSVLDKVYAPYERPSNEHIAEMVSEVILARDDISSQVAAQLHTNAAMAVGGRVLALA